MKKFFIEDVISKIGEEVELYGWVNNIRDHKKVIFVDLRDRSGLIQVVGDEKFRELSPEDVVYIKGIVQKRPENLINPKLKTGEIEVKAKEFKILSKAEELPIDLGKDDLNLQLPTLLDYRSLTLRHAKVSSIFKVQETVIDAFREHFKKEGFFEFQSPVITPETAEGGAEVFEISYFDNKAYLSQSPQFYKQILIPVFEKVFTVNKTLRAEPSVTTRHLAEVTTLDVEIGFIDSWEELMDASEEMIRQIFQEVENRNQEELSLHNATLPKITEKIPRIKLREAQEIIFKRAKRDVRKDDDLSPEDEREICKWALEEKGSDLIFVTHYPTSKRPFYSFEDPQDKGYTLSFDLLCRGVEWLMGGQRINDPKVLVEKAKEKGIDLEKSALYLQAFRYGMPQEGGFSIGSERITMMILGVANIREASLFPRDMERVDIRLSELKD